MKGKSLIGVILAAICVTVTYLLPGSEELSHEGITALGVLGMASILWISNTLPFGVTGLLALVMLVLLGVSDMASVFVGFSNSSVIFVITVFCLTAAVMNTKLTLRLINKLLRWAGSSAEKLVLAYMAAAALLSSVMSNVPVTVLFLGLAQPVLKAVGAKPGSSRLGKCLMIGIPFAAVNGGMATPAGSSFNVLAMGVFESIAGKPLTFLQWMAVGLPTAIVATLVCWICLVKIFKPEAINEECSASIREEAENAGKISAYEKKVLFMLVAMPVLWILGTWFPALDVTVVSIDGHLTDLKMLSQFGTLDQEKFYEDLAKGIIPEEVNFFMSNPSNYSKSAAPEGKQMICFTCPHQLDLPEEIEARLVDKMMVTAEKYIPGLSEHIIIKEVLFNSDIMTASGKGGAGIGIGQVAGQTGAYRPKIKLPVEGAYVVGAAAGGAGVGTELAVNSAIEFFDNYCK